MIFFIITFFIFYCPLSFCSERETTKDPDSLLNITAQAIIVHAYEMNKSVSATKRFETLNNDLKIFLVLKEKQFKVQPLIAMWCGLSRFSDNQNNKKKYEHNLIDYIQFAPEEICNALQSIELRKNSFNKRKKYLQTIYMFFRECDTSITFNYGLTVYKVLPKKVQKEYPLEHSYNFTHPIKQPVNFHEDLTIACTKIASYQEVAEYQVSRNKLISFQQNHCTCF